LWKEEVESKKRRHVEAMKKIYTTTRRGLLVMGCLSATL